MKMHNITGFIKWHIRNFKIGLGHLFLLNMTFLIWNILFVKPTSEWYFINLGIGLVPLVLLWLYCWIWYPMQESYKKYQREKQDLLNTIDRGSK